MKTILSLLFFFFCGLLHAQDSANFTRTEIIYGRKDGMALTLIKLTPKQHAKGKAIISLISGNWISNYSMTASYLRRAATFVNAGYTVFAVMHGSQPRYSIQDELEDIKRAVRFVRFNAKEHGVDPDHIGITGSSSGGHLSLMTAFADDKPRTPANDATDKVSARVQAAAVFFPPTDFLNWGASNTGIDRKSLAKFGVAGAFDFKALSDSTGMYEHIKNEEAIKKIGSDISPINSVSSDDPPVFIMHGDSDRVVPLQQSLVIIEKLKEKGVKNELIIKKGADHGWRDQETDQLKLVAWFDKYL